LKIQIINHRYFQMNETAKYPIMTDIDRF